MSISVSLLFPYAYALSGAQLLLPSGLPFWVTCWQGLQKAEVLVSGLRIGLSPWPIVEKIQWFCCSCFSSVFITFPWEKDLVCNVPNAFHLREWGGGLKTALGVTCHLQSYGKKQSTKNLSLPGFTSARLSEVAGGNLSFHFIRLFVQGRKVVIMKHCQ